MMRFFAVTCKHGHHGRKQYYPITFAIAANTLFEACEHAKKMPGVKHNMTVLMCKEISFENYAQLRKQSAYERAGLK